MALDFQAGPGVTLVAGAGVLTASAAALLTPGNQVKLVYRTANSRWEYADGTVPVLTGRTASISWEGTAAQIPIQGTGAEQFREGDTAYVRTVTL